MLGLFSRARRQSCPVRPSFRPTLERLEERDCPSPILSLHNMLSSTSKSVMFYGTVTNTLLQEGVGIQFSGVASGVTTTDANGAFRIQLTATGLGTETATTTQSSATTTLTDPNAPLITTLNSYEYPGGYYLFSGHVNGTVFAGETITFSGSLPSMNGQTCVVNANGDYSFAAHLLPGEGGLLLATATADAWGINNTIQLRVTQG
jgi:hypothetical protein